MSFSMASAAQSPLNEYLQRAARVDPKFVAYLANLECVAATSPAIAASIVHELRST